MDFQHTVQYYETDKMGITHHSNYVRFMEEARIAYLREIHLDFRDLEARGILSPVVAVCVRYHAPSTFGDVLTIHVQIEKFNGVRLELGYTMTNEQGQVVCKASSEHAFTDGGNGPDGPDGRNSSNLPMRMQHRYPDIYEILCRELEHTRTSTKRI